MNLLLNEIAGSISFFQTEWKQLHTDQSNLRIAVVMNCNAKFVYI
jgi:hypothetical protein